MQISEAARSTFILSDIYNNLKQRSNQSSQHFQMTSFVSLKLIINLKLFVATIIRAHIVTDFSMLGKLELCVKNLLTFQTFNLYLVVHDNFVPFQMIIVNRAVSTLITTELLDIFVTNHLVTLV